MTDRAPSRDSGGVVVGVDGAADGLRAAEWAARQCERHGLSLTVVHVREYQPWPLPPGEREALGAEADRILDEGTSAARTAAPEVTVHPVHADGTAAEQLVALASDAALLAVASRGRGGFGRLTLGSTGETVAGAAPVPAVLLRSGGERSGPVVVGIDEVVLDDGDSADDRGSAEPVLRFAFDHAAAGSGTLSAHHSIAVPPGVVPAAGAAEEDRLHRLLAPWRKEYAGVAVSVSVRVGSPAAHLVEMSDRAALLVLGRRGGPGLGRVAGQVVRHASGAIAVIGG
jgi:nucleotide-binding universal stress UspA family protein